MKIDPGKSLRQNLHLNRKSGEPAPAVKGKFKKVLIDAREMDVTARLDYLMEIIEEKAKKLKKNMTIKNLSEYRHYVKKFLKIFNEEFLEINQTFSWNRGSMKSYTIIKEIDEGLETLRKLFLEEQKDSLEIIKQVDAIRGLLMDLYI
ncbi:hypothetical protein BBF96_03850 [Anoxybacter fermentans]|uniref:DUF327 domain-containing protein n=1 Tax=Anoxybacter fermentans TaxID=1323375 RepID=A0A3Q9HPC0_9FIRM|nr:YaaR family protein [Anoxybacter fermentans]AZR72595.1 hypothetical protein BBF96_03850 [Anoxybacter fermentans]